MRAGNARARMRRATLAAAAILFSCRPFEYSPYQIPVDDPGREINVANLSRIAAKASPSGGRFRFAVLADTHTSYAELKLAVDKINSDTSIHFVLIAGDFTQFGFGKEYDWFIDVVSRLRAPYLVAIGNHDIQANGSEIYRRLFGPKDFSFRYRGVKFIVFDDNAREYECCIPDFAWLENEMAGAGDALAIVTVAHSPPFGDQLDSAAGKRLAAAFAANGVGLAIQGHQHNYHFKKFYGDGVAYLVVDNVEDRNYAVVDMEGATISATRVFF